MPIERRSRMCLELSADEMDALKRLADERGMPKVSLIRQWIRDEAKRSTAKPFDPGEFLGEFRRVFAGKIRRE